ncbi:MAG: hypothetical protein O3A74_07145, partial [archaeon]|nr:hypothetical protein [archaeon]
MTIYLGNYWQGEENHIQFDSTHWTQFFNSHQENLDALNNYTFPNGIGPIGRIGTDGLRALSNLPQDPDSVDIITDRLDGAMDGHNPSLMSVLSELIQNAMDQNATQIRIGYSEQILTFAHDGTSGNDSTEPFNARQLIQIFDLGSGVNKRNSIASEGRFGIGFKYWKKKFNKLVVRGRYSDFRILRIDINHKYELDSIGLAINEEVEPEKFKTGETTLFEFHIPKDQETEAQCNDIIANLDERILRSLPMMAARNGGQISINIGDRKIEARLETVVTDQNYNIYTFKQGDENQISGIITEFSLSYLLDRWRPAIRYYEEGRTRYLAYDSISFLNQIRSFMEKTHSKWDNEKNQNLEVEFNESKLRLCFRFDNTTRGMAGSLFVAPLSLFNLPCDVQAPWLLTDDRKAIHHIGGIEYKPEKIKWNSVLVELAYRAFLDSATLMASTNNNQICKRFLQRILTLPLTLSEATSDDNQKVHTSITGVDSLRRAWYGDVPKYLNEKYLGNSGLAFLIQYLLENNHTSTLDHLARLCPNLLLIPSEEGAFLPVFDWKKTTEDGNQFAEPSITEHNFDNVLQSLIDSLSSEEQDQKIQIDPSFVDCFGTVIVNDLEDGSVKYSFYESNLEGESQGEGDEEVDELEDGEREISRLLVDEFPDSDHGKEIFKLTSKLKATSIYRLPTQKENFGREVPNEIKMTVKSKKNQIREWLKDLHQGTYDEAIRQSFENSNTNVTDIYEKFQLWSEECNGLIDDFLIILDSSPESFSFAFIPGEDEKWVHLRGSRYAYGGIVRPNAKLSDPNPRLLQLNKNSELGVYRFGKVFNNAVPLPKSMLYEGSVWLNKVHDPLANNGLFQFGRIRNHENLMGSAPTFESGFSIDSIIQPLSDEDVISEVKKRLGLLFVDFIPLQRGGNQSLHEIKRLLPDVDNPLYPQTRSHEQREYVVSTQGNPFGATSNPKSFDLITHLLHKVEIDPHEVRKNGNNLNSTSYKINWKVDNGVIITEESDIINTGLILRVYVATEDRLWRTLDDNPNSRATHVLGMSRSSFEGQNRGPLWSFEQTYSIYYKRGDANNKALVNVQKLVLQPAPNDPVPMNLVHEEFTLAGPAFQTLRESRIATFLDTSLRVKGEGNGWTERSQSTNSFLQGQSWLPLPLNNTWDFVNRILQSREIHKILPLPVPVIENGLFNVQNIPTQHPLRNGIDSSIDCLQTEEIRELALEWLELLFSKGMGKGGIIQSLRQQLRQLYENQRFNPTMYPTLIGCLNGNDENLEEAYKKFNVSILYGLPQDQILENLRVPRLVLDNELGWNIDFSQSVPIKDFKNTERNVYLVNLEMNTTDVFPSRAFEIDDGAELYVLPNFPIDKWNLIQDAILDRFLDLNELAGNAISDNPSSEEITPSYMTTFCNLKSVVEMELREREEETVHVRLGKI